MFLRLGHDSLFRLAASEEAAVISIGPDKNEEGRGLIPGRPSSLPDLATCLGPGLAPPIRSFEDEPLPPHGPSRERVDELYPV